MNQLDKEIQGVLKKVEQQVVTIEFAKELKIKSYPQDGLWWWYAIRNDNGYLYYLDCRRPPYYWPGNVYVAPTVAELGKELPLGYASRRVLSGRWTCNQSDKRLTDIEEDNEANARARMWLYLKLNDLLK